MKRLRLFFICVLVFGASGSEDTKPEVKKGPKIINGSPAAPGQFPWQAALFFQQGPGSDFWFCSGTIISEEWILTAGHCANGAETVLVYTGSIDISLDINPTDISHEFIVHEDFVADSLANDIALVKLSKKLSFGDNVSTIPLSSEDIEVGTTVTVSGWGQTTANNSLLSPLLNFVDLVTISNEDCQKAYGSNGIILEDMVCAAINPTLIQTPCYGDSGGPVVVDYDTKPRHVAIASFVSDTGCESGFPSGYTRTAYFRDWIKEKTGV